MHILLNNKIIFDFSFVNVIIAKHIHKHCAMNPIDIEKNEILITFLVIYIFHN